MHIDEFFYKLPTRLIAQKPADKRDQSRLMVIDRKKSRFKHEVFSDVIDYLNSGDCLVTNNTRVIPARLLGKKKETGGRIEFVLLKRINETDWEVILKPGKRAKLGSIFEFGDDLKAEIIEIIKGGNRIVRFSFKGIFEEVLDRVGIIPLPPYISEKPDDYERYQTVYSKVNGSSAAPTAGLHFTKELLEKIKNKGIKIANVTLHIGIGTFRPVKTEDITKHEMHSEYFTVSKEDCDIINNARVDGKRIISVGTTTCRVLESISNETGEILPQEGWTDIFIYPGYKFKAIDCLITNFHLPKSTLLMLVSAFCGHNKIMKAYCIAIKKNYRFFSFGDAMLII